MRSKGDIQAWRSSVIVVGMAHKKKQWQGGSKQKRGQSGSTSVPTTGPYVEMFQDYRKELDEKYDRHERIVKLSRDCTIHSKRVIFILHRVTGNASEKDKTIAEAEEKLRSDILPRLKSIAQELKGLDPLMHRLAYAPGVEEFIEAVTYLEYLKSGTLISPEEILSKYLTFRVDPSPSTEGIKDPESNIPGTTEEEKKDTEKGEKMEQSLQPETIRFPLGALDFVLGVADLTGELMRLGINSVGSGEHDRPFELLPFMRALYCGFHSIQPNSRMLPKKMDVMRASLAKVENVCYTLKVRGSEIPKHMLADMFSTSTRPQNQQQDFDDEKDPFA